MNFATCGIYENQNMGLGIIYIYIVFLAGKYRKKRPSRVSDDPTLPKPVNMCIVQNGYHIFRSIMIIIISDVRTK